MMPANGGDVMSQTDLSRVLVKVAGLLLSVYALALLPYQALSAVAIVHTDAAEWSTGQQSLAVAVTVTPTVINLALGLILFWCGGRIVNRHLPIEKEDRNTMASSLRGLEDVAIAVVGAYLLADGLGRLVPEIGELVSFANALPRRWAAIPLAAILGLLGVAVQLAVGVGLMLRSDYVVAVRHRLIARRPA
jgi:hypothetical protein